MYIYLITNFANLAILDTVVWSVLAEVVVNVRISPYPAPRMFNLGFRRSLLSWFNCTLLVIIISG